MAAGDVVAGHSSVANNAYLTIQAGAGAEWTVHNIYTPGDAELYRTDGANDTLLESVTTGGWFGYFFHVTNAYYFKVKNVSGGVQFMGYDGIVTK